MEKWKVMINKLIKVNDKSSKLEIINKVNTINLAFTCSLSGNCDNT